MYDRVLEEATVLGDRVNGLKDGVSNEWFATFDLATPAAARGQKPSVVIDRPVLQQILLDQVGLAFRVGVRASSLTWLRRICCNTGLGLANPNPPLTRRYPQW